MLPLDPIAEARTRWEDQGWQEAASGMEFVTSVMRAQQILLARIDAVLRPLDLTFARFEVLMLLSFSRSGELPMSVIGSRLQVHPASVTSAVDRLERDQLVNRRPHPDDRRAVLVHLTDQGLALARKAAEALNAEVFTTLGPNERDLVAVTEGIRELRRRNGDY